MQATINHLAATSTKYCTVLIGWKRQGSLFYEKFEEPANYEAAVEACDKYGGRLAAKILRNPQAVRWD